MLAFERLQRDAPADAVIEAVERDGAAILEGVIAPSDLKQLHRETPVSLKH